MLKRTLVLSLLAVVAAIVFYALSSNQSEIPLQYDRVPTAPAMDVTNEEAEKSASKTTNYGGIEYNFDNVNPIITK